MCIRDSIWDPETKVGAAFDTRTDSSSLVAKAKLEGVTIDSIFITHTHNDHIADLDRLKAACPRAGIYSNEAEPWPGTETFSEGDIFSIQGLSVSAFTTSGHSKGGTTYYIMGLSKPVAVVGDAMFAGSMGGGIVSFEDAWNNNREKILTLPNETIICPGHGPMSSIGEEKRNNPFFAADFR